MRRREFLAAAAAIPLLRGRQAAFTPHTGRLKQALFRSAFDQSMTFEAMCREAGRSGAHGVGASASHEWRIMRRVGLVPTLPFPAVTPAPFRDGIARRELHDR